MKLNPSKPKEERDAKQMGSGVALAPSYAPEASSSFQTERFERNKTIPKTEAQSSAHSAPKTRNKAHSKQERKKHTAKEECALHYSSDESSEYEEETKPGAHGIDGPQAKNHSIEEPEPLVEESNLVDCNVGDRTMLVEADLAPELTSAEEVNISLYIEADLAPELTLAEEVNIQEEEDMIIKRKQYKRVLWFAMVFYVFAIIGNIAAFVLLFINPPPAFGRLYSPLVNGLVEAICFLFIATVIIFIPTRPCCRSSIRLEEYAPDDMQLLREAQISSVASFGLFSVIAIPCMVCLPEQQWVGYAFMTWFFAGTVFTLSRVLLLRQSKESRQKKSKLFWVVFVPFFLGLTGLTIWRCLNPVYPDCTVPYASEIGDGVCHGEPYATEECGFDGGDCINFFQDYPGCIVLYPFWIADGTCDAGPYNTLECGYDGGDCPHHNVDYPDCIVPNPSWIGDGNCDGRLYGTEECGFDGNDCLRPGERCRGNRECASEVCNTVTKVCDSALVSERYPNCSVGIPSWIGDGECDGGYYASEACGFDGGDCLELGKPCFVDEECASGFCHANTKICYLGVLENYPDCLVEYPRKIGNGVCDGGAYVTETCGYDGGDCLNPASQNFSGSLTLYPTFHVTAVVVLLSFQLYFVWY